MKKSSILILALFIMPVSFLLAQQGDLKAHYGQKTYDQYLAKDWPGLISSGKEAVERGIDFYYLRLRMGIAYGAQFNYRMAIVNYKKAIEFVPNDPVAQEYLYYAYLYAGMKHTASIYVANLPFSIRKIIKPEYPPFIGNIYAEAGYAIADYENKNIVLPTSSDIYFSEMFTRNSQTYFNFNLLLNMAEKISLSLAYTDLSIHSEHAFQYSGLLNAKNEEITVKQRDIYAAVNINDDNGLTIIPFIHNVNTAMDITEIEYDINTSDLDIDVVIDFNTKFSRLQWNEQLLGLGFIKRSGLIDLAASLSYSWLNETQQQQLSGAITYLPRGNYSLFFTPEIRLFNEDENRRMIFKLTSGFTLSSNIWAETAFTYGDLKSTHENFGAIVYNLPDRTKYKADAVINFGLGNGVSLSLRYQLTQKESVLAANYLQSTQTTGGFGIGPGQTAYVADWIETETFSPFSQHFIILGFNWAI